MANSKLSQYEGDTVTLSSSLSGKFTFPEWRGPPSLTPYTNLDDASGAINPEAPAASRLKYASNNRDLILSDAVIGDSGDYNCTYTGLGDHTITLKVNPAPVEAPAKANAEFKYLDNCYSVGKTLRLEAVYIGSGWPSLVQWSYSGGTGLNLMIKTSDCKVLGSVPGGFPAATRMEYMCPETDSLPDNTYRLTVTELTADELKQSWGATFTPPYGTVPAAVEKIIPVAADVKDGLSAEKIAVIICSVCGLGLLGGVGLACNKCKSRRYATSRNVESTSSSPKKAKSKLLNMEKQNSATGNADGGNEGKRFRPQPLPPPGANIREGSDSIVSRKDVEMQETSFKRSLALTKLPPIPKNT